MSRPRIWLPLALLLLALPAPLAAQTETAPETETAQPGIRVENPHGYGWWLGDVLVQRIHIDLPDGVTIEQASLPRPRAVDYWLDLRSITSTETDSGVTLRLEWQNFYSALEPQAREVPPSPIRLSDGTQTRLPGFRFVTSPIRPLAAPSTGDQLLADPVYRLIDPDDNRIGLALSGLALLAVLVGFAWHQAWGPFRRRADRPFTQAARHINRLPADAGPQRRRLLHRAFDRAFGRVLISADLPQFLSAHPQFAGLSDRLSGFFAESDQSFFGRAPADQPTDPSVLARELSRIERGLK